MARTLTRLERFDDQHAAAAMRTGMIELLRKGCVPAGSIMGWVVLERSKLDCRSDQLTSAGELLGTRDITVGKQTVVPNAVEPLGQDVHEEPANELAWLECHGLVSVRPLDAVVLVFERNAARVGGDQTAVGDGDAVGVAGEVGQHLLWPCKWALGVNGRLISADASGD